jgi:hypothetical protein
VLFYALLIASGLSAAIALVRGRGAIFFVAVTQTLVLRSLALMAEHGRPATIPYVPTFVFQGERIVVAGHIMLIATLMLVTAVALPSARHRTTRLYLPAVPRWFLWAMAGYYIIITLATRSVFFVAYAGESHSRFTAPAGGLEVLVSSVAIYELYRRTRDAALPRWKALLILLGILVLTDFSKGFTGLATGILGAAGILILVGDGIGRGWLKGAIFFLSLAGLASVLRLARVDVNERGWDSFVDAAADLASREEHRTENASGIETAGSAHEFAALTLECIALRDSGNDRNWKSVYLPFLYTFQPNFIIVPLGLERQREAAVEIRDYFVTNGAITVYGEAYWNGGYLGVVLILGAIFCYAYLCDCFCRSNLAWLLLYCNFAPCLAQGVGYGLSYEIRGMVNGLIAVGVYLLFTRLSRTRLAKVGRRDVAAPDVSVV